MSNTDAINYVLNIISFLFVILACGVSWTAVVGYGNGNGTYSVYAAIQAVFFIKLAQVIVASKLGENDD